MYYYILSTLLHWDENAQKNDPNYPHAKKNILIFMIGSVAYLFTAGFLWSKQYQAFVDSILPLSIIKDFFLWFMTIDIITCFILFKMYWGHGLLTELDGVLETQKSKENNKLKEKFFLVTPKTKVTTIGINDSPKMNELAEDNKTA